eukprot:TRINITY_DN9802_c0_g1_i1.p1 TRINITY_DN9802_c0_g1~~TRINITY_DN9802_c0_g1_i1.p1  ORF type:complete len:537 (-),score=112.18 TRINITY_DN9802_c0_g1_i1:318-1928(-)
MSAGGSSGQNFVSSNAGYSGTPLWKIRQQNQDAMEKAARQNQEDDNRAKQAALAAKEAEEAAELLRVSVDAVSLGKTESNGGQSLVRHLIVKDLRKVAARSKINIPTGGLFEGRAPIMLFALFDGQSSAEAPGPMAAECCAKQLIPKLLRNMSVIPVGYENSTFIKACLKKSFEDLDKEILRGQPGIHDGCGGAVALCVGERLFTAVCGKCELVVVEAGQKKGSKQGPPVAVSVGVNQGHFGIEEDASFLKANGGLVFAGEGGKLCTANPSGTTSSVSRSIGDRPWKGSMGGLPGSLRLIRSVPETRFMELGWGEKHLALVLSSKPVAEAVNANDLLSISTDFDAKPRAAGGEIAAKASEAFQNANSQCTSVVVYFTPKDEKAVREPAAKRAKKEAESVRFRHIVCRYVDCAQPFDPVRNRPVMRSREDAESELRRALRELIAEAKTMRLPANPKAIANAALQPTPKFTSLCKEISECPTAQKGGGMMGDLGWLQPDQLTRQFGQGFAETAKNLSPGQWSDLVTSEMGIHICQRIA